jgi:hypothetical protein
MYKKVNFDTFEKYGILVTSLANGIESLYLVWMSTNEKINELSRVKWFDENADHGTNKYRMKELGGAVFCYRGKLVELVILGMAKLIEDLIFDLRHVADFKFDFWNPQLTLKKYDNAIIVRSLANVIKHHHSVVSRGSRDGGRLIDEYGFPDGFDIEDWCILQPENVENDFVVILYYLETFLYDLVCQAVNVSNEFTELPRRKIHAFMEKMCLPEVVRKPINLEPDKTKRNTAAANKSLQRTRTDRAADA